MVVHRHMCFLSRLSLLHRAFSTARAMKRTAYVQHLNQPSLISSARDIFSHARLSSLDWKSLDVYAHIAFRGSSPQRKRPDLSFENWTEVVQNENDYIYRYIHKRLHERFHDVTRSATSLPVYHKIEQLGQLCDNSKSPIDRARDNKTEINRIYADIKSQIEIMNQLELASLLTLIKDRNDLEFRTIKRMIDIELRWLLKKNVKTRLMDLDLWLYLSDIFYECKMKSTFTHVLLNYLASEPDVNISNRQLLHMLFLVILKRQQDGLLEKFEDRIYNMLWKSPFEDIAVICMAYFKTKTPIRNHALLRRIIEQTTEHLSDIDPEQPGYGSIIKSVRYSRHPDLRGSVANLVDELVSEEYRMIIFASPYNAVQTIKLMESYRIYDPNLLNQFWDYMFMEIPKFRAKDIQYALTTLSNFAYKDLELPGHKMKDVKRLVDETIKRILSDQKEHHVYHVIPLARALAMFGYYDDNLTACLNKCLEDPDKLMKSKTVLEFEKSVLLLHTSIMIEGGNTKLNSKTGLLHSISKRVDRTIGEIGSAKHDSLSGLRHAIRGPEFKRKFEYSSLFRGLAHDLSKRDEFRDSEYEFNFQYTLPHQNYVDLIVSYRSKNPGCFDQSSLEPRRVPENERHVVIFGTHKTDYIDGLNRLCGFKRHIVRLLEKLGYDVIITDIYNPDYEELSRTINRVFSQQ